MDQSRWRVSKRDVLFVLMPSGVLVLYNLLHRRLQGPTAGGLAFLCMVCIAYWLMPKARVTLARLLAAGALALLTAWLLAAVLKD